MSLFDEMEFVNWSGTTGGTVVTISQEEECESCECSTDTCLVAGEESEDNATTGCTFTVIFPDLSF